MIVFEERRGRHTLRINQDGDRYIGVADVSGEILETFEDDELHRLKRRMRQVVDVQDARYFGMEGAIRRFLKIFPEGFADANYRRRERDYKVAASARLGSVLPLLLARGATPAQAAAVRPVFNTGILHEADAVRIGQVLSGPTGSQFVRGAALFADRRYSEGMKAMETATRPYGKASWSMVTYLPWLWLPSEHILLRPRTSTDFATRTGHDFAHEYEDTLFADVYRTMLDLVGAIRMDLARLEPADMIDIQGFLWVVGKYHDAEAIG